MKKLLTAIVILCNASALAGPGRAVTSSTFQAQTPSGPAWDSTALQGQWFLDSATGATNVNAQEFCDDDNSVSIAGVVQSITFSIPGSTNSNIIAFDVLVTVSNNLSLAFPISGNASNSHSEVQLPQSPAGGGDMEQTHITAEFALADLNMIPNGIPPYWPDPLSAGLYYIVAANEDLKAWYCWTPGVGQPYLPVGNFQIPT